MAEIAEATRTSVRINPERAARPLARTLVAARTEAGAGRTAEAAGINHVALEVGDIDQALAVYGKIFRLELRGRNQRRAFVGVGISSSR